jgi:hypothetical protein
MFVRICFSVVVLLVALFLGNEYFIFMPSLSQVRAINSARKALNPTVGKHYS